MPLLNTSSGLRGNKEQNGREPGWGWKSRSEPEFYLAAPTNRRRRSQARRDHPRAPRLPASSQQVSCRPAFGSRPPLDSASGHSARGAAGSESLRVTCGRAQPRVRPPAALSLRPALPPPFPPSRCPASDSAGHRRAARGSPGTSRREHGQENRLEAPRPPAPHVSARLARGPSTSSTGPRTAEVRTGNTLRGNRPGPALPAARAAPGGPRGGVAFPSHPPRPRQGETF